MLLVISPRQWEVQEEMNKTKSKEEKKTHTKTTHTHLEIFPGLSLQKQPVPSKQLFQKPAPSNNVKERKEIFMKKEPNFKYFPQRKGKDLDMVAGWEGEKLLFGPNIHILWEIYLYALLVSSHASIAFLITFSSSLENVHKIYRSSFSMIAYKGTAKLAMHSNTQL